MKGDNLFNGYQFFSVIDLPKDYEIYDFTKNYDADRKLSCEYGIGKYNEVRSGMYTQELFAGARNIHMGVDIAAPYLTPVKSFFAGEVFATANHAEEGNYGPTIITKHKLYGKTLFALYGHLAIQSLKMVSVGQPILAGQVFAFVGGKQENGGWNPHLHFQLSWLEPVNADLPGAVSAQNREQALRDFPDPRIVLGPVHP